MKRISGIVSGVSVLLGLVAVAAVYYYQTTISTPLPISDELVVAKGDSLSTVAAELVRRGVLREPYTLRLYARLNRTGNRIHAGHYRFPKNLAIPQLVRRLATGRDQVAMRLTIIEGWTFQQMRAAMNNAPMLQKETTDWDDARLMETLGHPQLHPEGQFYPDTYVYNQSDTDLALYRKAFALMQEKLASAWSQRKDGIQLQTPYQALILASIVEKESQTADELNEIAGVFDNRLRKGMRLQTDPSVIYGIGDAFTGNITRKHLKTDTPYNTYTRNGLPPTPISLPGYGALLAAVTPNDTESLYFVASGGGRHKFSRTFKEHKAAVKKYILRR